VVEAGSGRIVGKVVYENGEVAAGARLRLLSSGGATDWRAADVDGGFEFQGLAGSRYDIEARGDSGESARLTEVAPGDTLVKVRFVRAGGIRGRLLGASAASVRAHLSVDGVGVLPGLNEHVAQAREGAFELSGLAPGQYRVTAAADDAVARTNVVVRPGEVAEVVLRLQPVAALRGRAVDDATETPLAGAVCTAGTHRTSRADSSGHFTIQGVPESGAFIVRCEASAGAQLAGTSAVTNMERGSSIEVRAVRGGARLGLRFDVADGGLTVSQVVSSGSAATAGLLEGDRLVAVDSVRVADHLLDCLAHLHLRPPNTNVLLVVDRDDGERSLTLRTPPP
jgi:hypothetical protein